MTAPERIWATGDARNGSWTHEPLPEKWGAADAEYIRADILDAAEARVKELEAALQATCQREADGIIRAEAKLDAAETQTKALTVMAEAVRRGDMAAACDALDVFDRTMKETGK